MTTAKRREFEIQLTTMKERINFLEEANLNYARTFDVLAACSEFQSDSYRGKDVSFIVRAMFGQLRRAIAFTAMAIFSIEDDASFTLTICDPEESAAETTRSEEHTSELQS